MKRFFQAVPVVPLVVGGRCSCMSTDMQCYVNRRCAHDAHVLLWAVCSYSACERRPICIPYTKVAPLSPTHTTLVVPGRWDTRLLEWLNGTCASGEVHMCRRQSLSCSPTLVLYECSIGVWCLPCADAAHNRAVGGRPVVNRVAFLWS